MSEEDNKNIMLSWKLKKEENDQLWQMITDRQRNRSNELTIGFSKIEITGDFDQGSPGGVVSAQV